MYSFSSYAQETIHVGTEPTFAPFGFVDDKTSEIVGFDIDFINAIGKAEGMKVVIESVVASLKSLTVLQSHFHQS